MAGYWSKGGLLDFIKEYRINECLWKTKSMNYHNRYAKDLAYHKLLQILKQFEENATRDSVSRKINNIRTAFRKEYRKVVKSKRAGGAVYVPKLWYYKELNFLLDQDKDSEDGSNKKGNSEDYVDDIGAEIKYEELSFVSQWSSEFSESSLTTSDPPPLAYRSEGRKSKLFIEQETADSLGLREELETPPLAFRTEGYKRQLPIEQETADPLELETLPLAYRTEGPKRKLPIEQETADPLGLETLPLAYRTEGRKRKLPREQETSDLLGLETLPLAYRTEGRKRKLPREQETSDLLGLETLPLAYRTEGRKRKLPREQETVHPLGLGERLDTRHEDHHDVFGKHVAHRLRDMNPRQVKYAQKLISDVLFEAAMESLNRSCKIAGTLDSQSQYIEKF